MATLAPCILACLFLVMSASGARALLSEAASHTMEYLKSLEDAKVLSGTVGVSLDGSVSGMAFNRGYGYANYQLRVKNKPSFSQVIGSNTKFMTSVSIFQLHQKGLLNVDDLVTKYLAPHDFNKSADWRWCPKVYNSNSSSCQVPTIRHLLTMGSGIIRVDNCPYTISDWQFKHCLANRPPGGIAINLDIYAAIEGRLNTTYVLNTVIDLPLEFVPGTSYAYSNPGWWMATYIIEKISGMRIGDYYRKYIFEPAGMGKQSTFYGVGADVYGVHNGVAWAPAYVNLFAPYGALLQTPYYYGRVADPRIATGVETPAMPPYAAAGTFQGTVQMSWYYGELALGGGAGAVISTTNDMIKWFKTFIANPTKLGINSTTIANMFSYYNPYSAMNTPAADGDKDSIVAYFGPGIAVYPGKGGLWNMSQLMYEGNLGGSACRVHIKLRGANPLNSKVIVMFFNMVPGIPFPTFDDKGNTDCKVSDPFHTKQPATRLPQLLCDIAAYRDFSVYLGLNMTRIWGF